MRRRRLILSGRGPLLTARHVGAEAADPMPIGPEQFGNRIQAEIVRRTVLAKKRDIRLED